ncbi:hypothetical protein TWF694_007163 [Orbilia ellipsospora]|uniref:F-box domain-containing protein n=1 Tax=Orbilia ellipsospora TaxID=2528407 RepID=A0AAV9XJK9_9PEZI
MMARNTSIPIKASQGNFLLTLPNELVLQILSKTHWSDYYSVCRTSKLLRTLANVPNSLSCARYGCVPPFSSTPPSPDTPLRIHKLFSCATYRNGRPYYTMSKPNRNGYNAGEMITVPIETSPFREDPFSYPRCKKIVISWAHVDVPTEDNGESSRASETNFAFVPHSRALYINNLIVGTGRLGPLTPIEGLGTDFRSDREMIGPMDDDALSYITVKDVFDAFARDHPELKRRKTGEARIVGFDHVFNPGAGIRSGSHFEVRWTWADGT